MSEKYFVFCSLAPEELQECDTEEDAISVCLDIVSTDDIEEDDLIVIKGVPLTYNRPSSKGSFS